MSVTSVQTNTSQNLGSLILQALQNGGGTSSQDGLSGLLGDLTSVSSASKALAKAPAKVTSALQDLLTDQKDTTGDLATLKDYFKQDPSALASLLANLGGGTSTYSASGALSGNTTLASLLSGSGVSPSLLATVAGSRNSAAMIGSLLGGQGSDPLLESLNGSGSGGGVSFLG